MPSLTTVATILVCLPSVWPTSSLRTALSGAIGAISGKYRGMDRETSHKLCTEFVAKFKEKLACDSVDCSGIAEKYKVPETRCLAAVLLAAETLEEFMAE